MNEILEKEENLVASRRAWYPHVSRSWRDPETMSRYIEKEKPAFAVYCVRRPPKARIGGGAFRTICRRRPSAPFLAKAPVSSGLGYVPLETVKIFIELLELPRGWNSYNASQIRKENVNAAVGLLGRVMRPGVPLPIVVPTVRGGVQLEWHTNGINLEIAIDSPNDIGFFAEDIQRNEIQEEIDEPTLARWIDRISTR